MQKTLRVVFSEDSYPLTNSDCHPFPHLRVSSNCMRPGLIVEIVSLIASHLNLTVEPVHLPPFKHLHDASAYLENGTLDFYGETIEHTNSREEHFDYTFPLYNTKTLFATKRPDVSVQKIMAFFYVYESYAWALILLSFLLLALNGAVNVWVEYKLQLRHNFKIKQVVWDFFSLHMCQSSGTRFRLISSNFTLIVFLFFQVSIFMGLYQSWTISSVVRIKRPYHFTSAELIEKIRLGEMKLVATQDYAWYFDAAQDPKLFLFQHLRRALESNKPEIVDSNLELLQRLDQDGLVAIVQNDRPLLFTAEKSCKLVFSETNLPTKHMHFVLRKKHPLLQQINEAIFAQQIYIQKAKRKYLDYRQPYKCKPFSNPKPLKINPYYGLLILFFIGMSTATVFMLFEVLSRSKQKPMKAKPPELIRVQKEPMEIHFKGNYYGYLNYSSIKHRRRSKLAAKMKRTK